jgi:hypothetical protein
MIKENKACEEIPLEVKKEVCDSKETSKLKYTDFIDPETPPKYSETRGFHNWTMYGRFNYKNCSICISDFQSGCNIGVLYNYTGMGYGYAKDDKIENNDFTKLLKMVIVELEKPGEHNYGKLITSNGTSNKYIRPFEDAGFKTIDIIQNLAHGRESTDKQTFMHYNFVK